MTPRFEALGVHGWGTYEVEWKPDPVMRRVEGSADAILVPGFVDLHIHGAFGVDFMSADQESMKRLCGSLRACGYEAFLPTTVTASPHEVLRALSALPDDAMVQGFHLEGPFISPKHPGAQPAARIAPPPGVTSEWTGVLDHPRLKIVTLAPEIDGAAALVTRLRSRKVRVSMGHTDATFAQAARGFELGVHQATHTFNAMRPFHHREAGAAGFVLLERRMTAELIYDRHHVSREAADLLFRNKPRHRVVAVSDCTMAAGLADGSRFDMWGSPCVVSQGTVRLASNGALAGSSSTLLDCFRNLHADFGPQTAVRACSLNPRRALGRSSAPTVWIIMDKRLDIGEMRDIPKL